MAAMFAGLRAKIEDVVGVLDRQRIVLDQKQGIAECFELFESTVEAVIVAGMEADRGFIEDVEDAGEAAAELARRGGCAALRRRLSVGARRSRER